MRKSIFTLVLFASIQIFSFAQEGSTPMTLDENIEKIENLIAEKNDITGTFAVNNQLEIFIDDAKVNITDPSVIEIQETNLRDLLKSGLAFIQEDPTEYACYRYRVVSDEGSPHKMYLFECPNK